MPQPEAPRRPSGNLQGRSDLAGPIDSFAPPDSTSQGPSKSAYWSRFLQSSLGVVILGSEYPSELRSLRVVILGSNYPSELRKAGSLGVVVLGSEYPAELRRAGSLGVVVLGSEYPAELRSLGVVVLGSEYPSELRICALRLHLSLLCCSDHDFLHICVHFDSPFSFSVAVIDENRRLSECRDCYHHYGYYPH
ncbi:hypothetical protein FOZ60_006356 [Perkinsus olseni]|uniref:Uncharacterized protein n=1 Tax=Perkinsus olseni TaxID=32597 RepID=A0A7J6NPS0_PEROL|nr:hypothetical protein FOZ60_006356 [Perkinsus olseni]